MQSHNIMVSLLRCRVLQICIILRLYKPWCSLVHASPVKHKLYNLSSKVLHVFQKMAFQKKIRVYLSAVS